MEEPATDPPPGLKPIAGTAGRYGEPRYKKPRLPDKGAILDYYARIAPLLLEHASGRLLNLLRCPAGHCLYQRNRNHPAAEVDFAPPIHTVPVTQKNGRTEDYLFVEDAEGVLACVGAEGVEFHGWGSRADAVERPDRISFDLDPGEGTSFADVKHAAFTLRGLLAEIGLRSFPLLSGGKGVHVVVPLAPEAEWPAVRDFTRRICTVLAEADPARFTVGLPKAERTGRIFLDWLRNQRTATAILPWSLRARAGAPVAAPVSWEELPDVASATRFAIRDLGLLLKRGRSRALKGWGKGEQTLPRLG